MLFFKYFQHYTKLLLENSFLVKGFRFNDLQIVHQIIVMMGAIREINFEWKIGEITLDSNLSTDT